MDWKTCVNGGNSVKITPDRKRAAFLIKQAEKTLRSLRKISMDENNASVFFPNYYDAFLELMHAIMYARGYRVNNHYCLGYYLRDAIKDDESYRIFDRARSIRNSLIYYGETFDKPVIDEVIAKIISSFEKLKKEAK